MKRTAGSPLLVILILSLFSLLTLYSIAYLGLKRQSIMGNGEGYYRSAGYRFGGRAAHQIFWPAEQLDRFLRPAEWGWKDDPQVLGIEFDE